MSSAEKAFCFCTLAIGENYRNLAVELAQDIAKYSPETPFLILTDFPEYFSDRANINAFKHQPQGIKFYHDKRCVIAKALSLFRSCIFLDADMRIIGDVPENIEWLPGITARTGTAILKHNKRWPKHLEILEKVAQKLNLNLEEVKFVNEFLFTVTRDGGREQEFLESWEKIAPCFELKGIYDCEGNTIGLAAAETGFPVRFDDRDRFPFFKDKIERVRIKQGQVNPREKSAYFQRQQELEYPLRSPLKKIFRKIRKVGGYFWRKTRLRLLSLRDFNFYYR